MSWAEYHLKLKSELDQTAVSACLSLIASTCTQQSERPKEESTFSYDAASGDLRFSTGKTFWESPRFVREESINPALLITAYERLGESLAHVFTKATVERGVHCPVAEALDDDWLLCPHCGDAHPLASIQPFVRCPSCQSVSQNPIESGRERFVLLSEKLREALAQFEQADSLQADFGRFLVAMGWAEPGVLGVVQGVDLDGEVFNHEYVVGA